MQNLSAGSRRMPADHGRGLRQKLAIDIAQSGLSQRILMSERARATDRNRKPGRQGAACRMEKFCRRMFFMGRSHGPGSPHRSARPSSAPPPHASRFQCRHPRRQDRRGKMAPSGRGSATIATFEFADEFIQACPGPKTPGRWTPRSPADPSRKEWNIGRPR